MIAAMTLAGIRVPDQSVHELAGLVDEPTAAVLLKALELKTAIVALSIEDRERIIRALDDPPDGLAELRSVLVREHEWRVRGGACLTTRDDLGSLPVH